MRATSCNVRTLIFLLVHLLIHLSRGLFMDLPSPKITLGVPTGSMNRRGFVTPLIAAAIVPSAAHSKPNGLILITSDSGLKWVDAKVGTGEPLAKGTVASIDYTMASTAGRFPQIYSTKEEGSPYRWTLGDGSTIQGIEMAVLGTADIPPMLPGGIRRLVVPSSLAYESLAKPSSVCVAGGPVNPIPPKDGGGAYQRWVQFYCNPRIPYQPDLVLDIKLYGKR